MSLYHHVNTKALRKRRREASGAPSSTPGVRLRSPQYGIVHLQRLNERDRLHCRPRVSPIDGELHDGNELQRPQRGKDGCFYGYLPRNDCKALGQSREGGPTCITAVVATGTGITVRAVVAISHRPAVFVVAVRIGVGITASLSGCSRKFNGCRHRPRSPALPPLHQPPPLGLPLSQCSA